MANWEGKSRGGRIGHSIFIYLLQRGGLKAAYGLLPLVTSWYRLFVPAATRPLMQLYRERLGFNPVKSRLLLRRNLSLFGQTLIDKVAVLAGVAKGLRINSKVPGLEAMIAEGKGGLLISAHLGNWEAAGHFLERYNARVNVVMYDGEGQELKAHMERFNSKRSFNIISISPDLSHIYEMNAALNRGELVCMHADRFRPGNRTMVRSFLGAEAHFPAGPFILASKLRAPVCFVFAFKKSRLEYDFTAEPVRTYEGRGMEGAEAMLTDYIAILERRLREYPEQWFNYYDFWAARP